MTPPPAPDPGAASDLDGELDTSTTLLAMAGARLARLRAESHDLAGIRKILIAEMAQRDPQSPLTCTASFVDVSELEESNVHAA